MNEQLTEDHIKAFNSLSRDHIQLEKQMKERDELETFNSLSRDHRLHDLRGERGMRRLLSTPSLGITHTQEGPRIPGSPRFQLPLSGSPVLQRPRAVVERVYAFNSLSRDHLKRSFVLVGQAYRALSTPSLGITTSPCI